MKWKIDNVKIDNQVVLAPMSGICDYAFRHIIKSMGCGLIETEMISDRSVLQYNDKTKEMLEVSDCEKPVSLQIFGSEIESLTSASKFISENTNADILDINMGCPVRKVAEKGKSGCALLRNPTKAYDIIKSIVDAVDMPVTVKIRSGWDKYNINAVEIAEKIEDAGASAITVHPRTREQKYMGKSDWNIIKEVKKSVTIPVIGNGDITSCYEAERMLDETGCDAVMIGRAVLGNPWIIADCVNYLEEGIEPSRIRSRDKMEVIKKHAQLLAKHSTPEVCLMKMRKHAAYYVKGHFGSVDIKRKIFTMKTTEELLELLEEYMNNLKY
ncbi:MAG: tRNA dihydrouridine synthase DusB [Methanosphaera sp. rholeuAM130]|nr:MAG: tRNA dihydrouridine synthase DusB [Methanosphaera sp. rholeuAM130]